ncbi:MAG: hypothetical protein AB9903_08815 [Vulcanimicrobiota bacterium]
MIDTIRGTGYTPSQTGQIGGNNNKNTEQPSQQTSTEDYWNNYTQDSVEISSGRSGMYGPNPFTDDPYREQYSQVFNPDFPQEQLDPSSVDTFDYDNTEDANNEYDKRSNLKYVHDNGYSIARFSDYASMSSDDVASINNGTCDNKELMQQYQESTAGFQKAYGYEGMEPQAIAEKEEELANRPGAGVVK